MLGSWNWVLYPQDHIVPRKCKYMLCHPSGSYLLGIQKGLLLLKYLQTFCSCIHKIPDPKNLCLPDKLVNLLLQDLHFFDRPMNRKIQSIYLFMDLTLHLLKQLGIYKRTNQCPILRVLYKLVQLGNHTHTK